MRPIIACDVDDVLADLIGEWLSRYNAAWGDDLTPERITSWMISDHVKPECGLKILDFLQDPGLYNMVRPFPGALETVNQLRELGRVVFLTSCEGPHGRDAKYAWLIRHGFMTEKQGRADYVTMKEKALFGADFLIDDGLHNVDAFPRRSLLVTRPHNRAFTPKTAVRLADFSEAPARIKIITG